MKRTNAIKQLKYWLYGATNNPYHQEEAEALLNKIEQMGMMPPTSNTDIYNPSPAYEWEPEDE